MRILQVIPTLGRGGAERLVLNISEALEKLGHEVLIVIFRPEIGYPELVGNLNVQVVPSRVSYSVLGKDILETDEFDKLVAKYKPDVIHSHLLESEFVSRRNPAKGVTYVTHWHGCHPPTNPRSFSDYFKKDTWWNINAIRLLQRGYAKCDNQFICISEFIGNYVMRALHPKKDHLKVILNGCDINEFIYEGLEKDNNTFTLLSVGSFHAYKNHIFLLKVMKHLSDNGVNDLRLQFLGDGAERQQLENFVKSNDLNNQVEFLGYVKNPNSYMNQAHALVHSAIDEPFGLILLEAMSVGLPIVAFNSGGVPEIVENGKTGFLTDVNDIDGFANSILKLKSDPSLVAQFSKAGRASVQKFNMIDYVKKIEALYFELVKTKPV
ncbi:MAG: glycosyltransferase [Flavobacteriales bacterium]|nr:glycosyltransferase [Flavobacteriales bacterium]